MHRLTTFAALLALPMGAAATEPAPNVKATISRGLAFLVRDSLAFKETRKCAECHHAPFSIWALNEGKRRGYEVDEKALAELTAWAAARDIPAKTPPKQDQIDVNEAPLLLTLGIEAGDARAAQDSLKKMLASVLSDQGEDGSWKLSYEFRPIGSSPETLTALALLALSAPSAPDMGQAGKAALEKGLKWLRATNADDEPQVAALRLILWQRLGLPALEWEPLVKKLRGAQNADGGWGQTNGARSDAYATGQVLYALAEAGAKPDDETVRKAQAFLAKSQRENGAWAMVSRAIMRDGKPPKDLSPITHAGSAWAVMGLVRSAPAIIESAETRWQLHGLPHDPARPTKPNILVIVADDLGYGDIGVHGGKDVPTPHLDALAASGVRCTNGYVSAPYCSPSRAGFLTGRYQTRFGHEFNPHVGEEGKLGLPLDQRTIADHLRGAGYATGLVGKWHQGFDRTHHPQSRGFDEYFGFLVGGHNYLLRKDAEAEFGSAYSKNMIYRNREVQKLDGYTTELFTDEALAFMERHKDRPWFLYLAYNAVHTPLELLEKYGDRVPTSITDRERRGYLSLLLGLDDAVGRVTAYLRESGKEKDTLIFFFSDNGGSGRKPFLAYNTGVNRPLRGDKGQTLEGGIHVPFFVSWPGQIPAGKTYDQPVITLDILPTADVVAGAKADADADGVNLLKHLTGEVTTAPHEALYWRFGPQKAVRKGKWKLVDWRDFETKRQSGWQLYDLVKDMGEKNDLAKAEPQVVTELSAAWEKWNQRNMAPLWHGGQTEDPTAPNPKEKP